MYRYKRAYYKVFAGLCEILEEIEDVEVEEEMSIECRERLEQIEEEIKKVHIEVEEEIIR